MQIIGSCSSDCSIIDRCLSALIEQEEGEPLIGARKLKQKMD
jgi:ABC-type histidine transport system ATPase subunit